MRGGLVLEKTIDQSANPDTQISIGHLPAGTYVVNGTMGSSICRSVKFIKL